jgi:hypothetical protein
MDPRFKVGCFSEKKELFARELLLKAATELHSAVIKKEEDSQAREGPSAKIQKTTGIGRLFKKMGYQSQQTADFEDDTLTRINNVSPIFL